MVIRVARSVVVGQRRRVARKRVEADRQMQWGANSQIKRVGELMLDARTQSRRG